MHVQFGHTMPPAATTRFAGTHRAGFITSALLALGLVSASGCDKGDRFQKTPPAAPPAQTSLPAPDDSLEQLDAQIKQIKDDIQKKQALSKSAKGPCPPIGPDTANLLYYVCSGPRTDASDRWDNRLQAGCSIPIDAVECVPGEIVRAIQHVYKAGGYRKHAAAYQDFLIGILKAEARYDQAIEAVKCEEDTLGSQERRERIEKLGDKQCILLVLAFLAKTNQLDTTPLEK